MLGTLDPLNPWGGLAFASTLLSVAACNFSLLGLLFLVLFLVWAMYCLPALHSQRGLAINRAYWGTVAGLSTIALLVQCGVQLAFIAQTPGIRRPFITQFLRLVGFARINSYAGFVTHFVSILIASITTVYAATKAVRRRENRVSFRGNQNVSETGVDSTAVNTWALTFLAMLGIVFPRPSLVSLPYLMSLLIKASTLEADTGAIRSEMSMHARLQGYAALHLAALYSWQWVPLPSSWHLLGGEYLGLFVLSSPDGKHGWLAIVEGVTVLGWLAVMVIVQGWDLYHFRTLQPLGGLDLVARVLHVDDQEGTLAVDEQSRCSGQEEETEESQLTDPLLEPYPPSSPHSLNPNPDSDLNTGNHQTNISLSMYSCPSSTFLWILNTWRSVCCHTNLVACTVCAISLLRPSVTGFILLLLGIAMSLHWRGAWRVCIARFTAFVVAVWMLTSYIATVWKGTDLEATPTLEAWGVHAFDGGAPLVLMFMTLASLGSYALGALGGSDAFHQSPAQDPPSRYHPAACLGSFRTLSTASLLVTLFFLGTSQYTWIHGIYLASIFLWLAHLTLWSLCPTVNFLLKNSSPFVGNVVFSFFTVLIVSCMYFVYVASLDPFNGVFHWMDQFPHVVAALQIAGLWDPKVKDIALALAVLFLSLVS